MSALRQRMIAAMQMHGFSARTQESYLAAVRGLAKYTRRSPDTLRPADLKRYFEYLVRERRLAPASVRIPRPFGRRFHADSATHSTTIRPLIPRPFGHPSGRKRRRTTIH
ncbi:phage integrase N-terminal SAM-like domain-containing protein [Thioflavicoccus mobilis]|uniref:phage integrase N-terminal SAM-like domain-containing protein n=1 Tax=Thioflavicoccus mobilis TaxID=80679 RepID=UPI000A054761|nr:phage integrase N-terminal SAM-like domain-containing protein [Thioflavicoccus mobilis]